MAKRITCLFAVAYFSFLVGVAHCEDVYYYIPVSELTIQEGELPNQKEMSEMRIKMPWRERESLRFLYPYAVGDGGEEIYIGTELPPRMEAFRARMVAMFGTGQGVLHIGIRSNKKQKVLGTLYMPKTDFSGTERVRFSAVEAAKDQKLAREKFLQLKEGHYERLFNMSIPGTAWFRHRINETKELRDVNEADMREQRFPFPIMPPEDLELQRSYSLFSGGRALSESLQLERELRVLKPGEATIDVNSIEGITVEEISWKEIIAGLKPGKDSLAKYVPEDQHVIFFPSFRAMTKLIDKAKEEGTPIFRQLDPRSEDFQTHERYQKQLCLPIDKLSRILGPALISSVAFTGSDPYLRTGSDVAVLFEARTLIILQAHIDRNHSEAISDVKGAKAVSGKVAGIKYSGVVSPRREVCSYMASLDNVLVVTNSLKQLERIVKVSKGELASIASLDEYVFFRDRYKLGSADETALLILTDSTIRRLCGARWRIGCSRRTRAAAAMAELQSKYLDKLACGEVNDVMILKEAISGAGEIRLTPRGIESSIYGTLDFLTPISELEIKKVTEQERRAYAQFRQRYQFSWRQFFDPIAIQLSIKEDELSADLTVRPLIVGTEYREFMEVAGQAKLSSDAGDRHKESLLHFVLSIDPNSRRVQQWGNFAMTMAPQLEMGALSWIGDWVSVYADDDPLWEELKKTKMEEAAFGKFMENNIWRLPLGLHVDVGNAFKLTAFMVSVRAFIEQSSPEMTVWETRKHNDKPYVRVSLTSEGLEGTPRNFQDAAVYYAVTPKALVVTLNEALLKRSLDRMVERETEEEQKQIQQENGWLGKSAAATAKRGAFIILQALAQENMDIVLKARSWGNLAILNEWKRCYPNVDPLELHNQFWQAKLVCPSGGQYVWNEQYQTMESTVYGHPGQPRTVKSTQNPLFELEKVDFGLTFEGNGLRARTVLRK